MERYIKVDELETIVKVTDWSNPAVPIVLYMIIDRCSTADVAPRSEVAREIFEEIEKEIESALGRIRFADPLKIPSGLPREKYLACREGKTQALCGMERFINDLKQKYTEDQK